MEKNVYFFETIVNAVQLKDKVMPESCKYVPLPCVFVFNYQSAAIFGIFHYVLFSIKHWISVISKLLHSVFIL